MKSGWRGEHTFKGGWGWSRNSAVPQGVGANLIGTFSFPTNAAFVPADARSYPWRMQIRLGQIEFDQRDWRTNFSVQDKWQVSRLVTLNLGLRYDYQHITPLATDAFAPRLGVAYDVMGSGKTLVRGGIGKFYQYHQLNVLATLLQSAVVGPAYVYDTGQVASPAITGVVPSNVCLQPTGASGLAVLSPACQTTLSALRDQVNAGGYTNDQPTVDGNRLLPYLWSFSAGIKREVITGLAVSADYVGNRGRNQVAAIDINEGPVGANGRISRLGVDVFDPDGVLVPPASRSTVFRRFLQYQSREDLDPDYNSLELAIEKRHANRWSGRIGYTLARARDVGLITFDTNPRGDYARTNFDNRHAFAMSANVDIWRGLSGGVVFRAYSGYPINETIGSDANGDGDNNDRPLAGVNDLTRPILSPLDASGRAIRNGIDGEKQVLLDGRIQWIHRMDRYQAGVFLEIYNLGNQVNFGNPTGTRTSSNFMVPVTAGDPRTAQIGFRLIF